MYGFYEISYERRTYQTNRGSIYSYNSRQFYKIFSSNSSTKPSIADAFVKKFICIFGSPKGVLTDQGTYFLSNLMKRLAKRFRIRQFKTTAFHPQSNGSIERSYNVLGVYLKQFVSEIAEWDDWLELATFSYNTSVHEGTKCTPYELVFGKLARLPTSDPPLEHEKLETYDQYLKKLITCLHEIRGIARQNLINAKEKSKFYYDKNINPQNFKVGDDVFLLEGGKIHKFANQYSEPYEVLEILGKGNVKIKKKNTSKVVNLNRLKLSRIQKQTKKE